jgi:hypothetical protein
VTHGASAIAVDRRGPDVTESTDLRVVALAIVLAVAAGVHGTLLPSHARESALLGFGFGVAAAFQLSAAVLVLTRPTVRLLSLVAVGSALMIAAWALSRTVGLPLPPSEWTPEPLGFVDVLTSLFEASAIGLALALARERGDRHGAGAAGWTVTALWLVGSAGVFLLAVASAHESHGQGADDHLAGHVLHAGILATAVALLPLAHRFRARLGRGNAS